LLLGNDSRYEYDSIRDVKFKKSRLKCYEGYFKNASCALNFISVFTDIYVLISIILLKYP